MIIRNNQIMKNLTMKNLTMKNLTMTVDSVAKMLVNVVRTMMMKCVKLSMLVGEMYGCNYLMHLCLFYIYRLMYSGTPSGK